MESTFRGARVHTPQRASLTFNTKQFKGELGVIDLNHFLVDHQIKMTFWHSNKMYHNIGDEEKKNKTKEKM